MAVAALDERIGQGEQGPLADQGFAAEPRHAEAFDGRQLVVEDLQHRLLHLVTHDRGVLVLEAVRAVEVAAQAADDRQAEL